MLIPSDLSKRSLEKAVGGRWAGSIMELAHEVIEPQIRMPPLVTVVFVCGKQKWAEGQIGKRAITVTRRALVSERWLQCYCLLLDGDFPSVTGAPTGAPATSLPCSNRRPLWADAASRCPWKFITDRIETAASGPGCQVCPPSLLVKTPWACSAVASRRWPPGS